MAGLLDDDLIEVISVFKCRFCQFRSSDAQEVRSHVTSTHMTVSVKEEVNDKVTSKISSLTASVDSEILQDHSSGTGNVSATGEVVLDDSSIHAGGAILEESGALLMENDGVGLSQDTMEQAVSDVLSVQEPAAVTAYDTVVTPDGNIILEYRDIVSDGDKIQVDLPTSDLKQHGDPLVPNGLSLVTTANQEIADASQDISFTSGEIMNLKIDQPTQSIVSTGVTGVQLDGLMLNTTGVQSTIQGLVNMDKTLTYGTAISVPPTSFSTQTGTANAGGIEHLMTLNEDSWPLPPKVLTGTRELFLCGQCNMGFVSMDECKTHIEQNHQLSVLTNDTVVESNSAISGPDNPAPNKHSLGVQASGAVGRPRGKKRKEVVEEHQQQSRVSDSEKAEKQQDELAQEACFVDDYRTDLSGIRRVSSRAVKTPRHLLSEYYIGQKKPSEAGKGNLIDAETVPLKRRKKWRKAEASLTVSDKTQDTESNEGGLSELVEHSVKTQETEIRSEESGLKGTKIQNSGKVTNESLATIEPGQVAAGSPHKIYNSDDDYIPPVNEKGETSDEKDSPKLKQGEHVVLGSDIPQVKPVESIYPTEDELLGIKMAGHRNPYGQRLTHKFEIDEELKTQKHKYTIKCKYKSCRGRFLSKETHDTHLKCHRRRPGRNVLVCFECEQSFNNWSACKYHLWREHKVDLDLYRCDQCDFRTDMTCKMDLHKVVHREERPYACRECGRGFKQPAQLRNHEVLHEQLQELEEQLTPQDSKSWFQKQICDICEKAFANSKTLRHHQMVVHGRLRPFLCPHCDHTASTRGALQLHIRIHTGEKPFKCDQCSFSSSDHNTLRRHRMRHTGEKPYRCPHCPYSCIQSVSIKTHIQYKHSDQMSGLYKCDTCDFNSVNQKLYLSHLSDHELGLIPSTGVSKTMRRHTSKKQSQLSTMDTLYACAQCSYTSTDMATLVGHLLTHKKRVASTAPPAGSQTLVTDIVEGIVLDGGKSKVSTVQIPLKPASGQAVMSSFNTLQVLSEMPTGVVDGIQPLTQSNLQTDTANTGGFLKEGMVLGIVDETEQTSITMASTATAVASEHSGNHRVTYVNAQSMEEQGLTFPAAGEMVYTLKPGQTVMEPLSLLEDAGEESTFLCMEDGRLQPISLTDLQGGQAFLNDKLLVQDITGTQVFPQSSYPVVSHGQAPDSELTSTLQLESTRVHQDSEGMDSQLPVSTNTSGQNTDLDINESQSLVQDVKTAGGSLPGNMESVNLSEQVGNASLPEQMETMNLPEHVGGTGLTKQAITLPEQGKEDLPKIQGDHTVQTNNEISFEIVSSDIAMVTVQSGEIT